MISSLECFRMGPRDTTFTFIAHYFVRATYQQPESREPEMTARDHGATVQGAATFWGLYRKRVHALSASLRMEIKKSSVH